MLTFASNELSPPLTKLARKGGGGTVRNYSILAINSIYLRMPCSTLKVMTLSFESPRAENILSVITVFFINT